MSTQHTESRLADLHTDHEICDALDGFAAYLQRGRDAEEEEDTDEVISPEFDPKFRQIAALERAGRYAEADAMQEQWLDDEALYPSEYEYEN